MYFSGQGRVYIASRDEDGDPLAFLHVGNVPELNLELTTDTVEHMESRSGNRVVDKILTTKTGVAVNLTLEDFNAENFAIALFGEEVSVAGASLSGGSAEVLPSGLVAGDYVKLAHGKISAVTVKDSTGSPLTLVVDSDYEITNADTGMLKILDPTGFVQPFKVEYTYAATVRVPMFTQPRKEYWIRFDGLNTADANKPCTVDLYKVSLNPTSALSLISNEFNQFPLAGTALYDDTKPDTGSLGKFGMLDFLDATP